MTHIRGNQQAVTGTKISTVPARAARGYPDDGNVPCESPAYGYSCNRATPARRGQTRIELSLLTELGRMTWSTRNRSPNF
jgi:hypothetical protein